MTDTNQQNNTSLAQHLKKFAQKAYDYLLKEAQNVSPADSRRFASENWPAHTYGIGQDGSIAGIVYHVAAWKTLTLPMFAEGGTLMSMAAFHELDTPDVDDYLEVLAWLRETGDAWNAALLALPSDKLFDTRQWGTQTVTLADYIDEMGQHDIQHAAQLEYLQQRLRVE